METFSSTARELRRILTPKLNYYLPSPLEIDTISTPILQDKFSDAKIQSKDALSSCSFSEIIRRITNSAEENEFSEFQVNASKT